MEISKKIFLKLPEVPGVYIFWKEKTPIYIGKSVNLKSRLNSYLNLNLGVKTRQMLMETNSVTYIEVTSDLESLLLEAYLIKKHKPKYNIVLKDDKHALYIVITKEKFPRVLSTRKVMDNDKQLLAIFGPFPNSNNVKVILKMLRKVFPYSDHKIGKKPCLYSHLGLCNPCPNVALENKEYLKNIKNIKLVLSRKFSIVRNTLEKEMNKLSTLQKYEEAKIIRDKMKVLDYITQEKINTQEFLTNPNMAEDIRTEEINSLITLITRYSLHVTNLHRIECYDVSHLSGVATSASMVVLLDGECENKAYRHFRIKQKNGQSDYNSMSEVAKRRIKYLDTWGKPDLIIVDGGLGQVNTFNAEFKKSNILVVGIAKHPDRLVFPDGTKVKLVGSALNIVSRIRNEAHRFARRYHHLLISKSLLY